MLNNSCGSGYLICSATKEGCLVLRHGTLVYWIKCSTLKAEFVGSNCGHAVVFSFFFFIFFIMDLFSWSPFEMQDYHGINSQPCKKAIEINLSPQKEISMKNYSSAICGQTDRFAMFGGKEKKCYVSNINICSFSRNPDPWHQDGHATRDPEGSGAGPWSRGHRAQAVQDADAGSQQPAQQQPRQAPVGPQGDSRHRRPDFRQRRRPRQRRIRRQPVIQHRRRRQLFAEFLRPRRQPHEGLRDLEGPSRPVSLRPALVQRDLQNVASVARRYVTFPGFIQKKCLLVLDLILFSSKQNKRSWIELKWL